jgi:hypothetical protein
MFRFFRQIRQSLLSQNKVSRYLLYALGEIILVVIGILLALQVNNWNETQNLRQVEFKLLQELKTDLEETRADLWSDKIKADEELRHTDSLYQVITINRLNNTPMPISISALFLYQRSALYPKKSAYKSLQAYGINTISNDSLRKNITDFFELHLVRVNDLEKIIKEINEKDYAPYLERVSKPTTTCLECTSLADLFASRSRMSSNLFRIEIPEDELLHLLKKKYMAYSSLRRLYDTTEVKIERLIEIIDAESQNKGS